MTHSNKKDKPSDKLELVAGEGVVVTSDTLLDERIVIHNREAEARVEFYDGRTEPLYSGCVTCFLNLDGQGCGRYNASDTRNKDDRCYFLSEKERLFNDTFR